MSEASTALGGDRAGRCRVRAGGGTRRSHHLSGLLSMFIKLLIYSPFNFLFIYLYIYPFFLYLFDTSMRLFLYSVIYNMSYKGVYEYDDNDHNRVSVSNSND